MSRLEQVLLDPAEVRIGAEQETSLLVGLGGAEVQTDGLAFEISDLEADTLFGAELDEASSGIDPESEQSWKEARMNKKSNPGDTCFGGPDHWRYT